MAAHPGYAATNLQMVGPQMSGSDLMERMSRLGNTVFAQSAADGALPSLYAATAPEVRGGQFFGPDRLFGMRGSPKPVPFLESGPGPRNGPEAVGGVRGADRCPVPDPRPAAVSTAGPAGRPGPRCRSRSLG